MSVATHAESWIVDVLVPESVWEWPGKDDRTTTGTVLAEPFFAVGRWWVPMMLPRDDAKLMRAEKVCAGWRVS